MGETNTYILKLGKTYYDKGFFNLGVEVDHLVADDVDEIFLFLGKENNRLKARLDRNANLNGTPRIHGGVNLRNWFWKNFQLGEQVKIEILSPTKIWLHGTSSNQTQKPFYKSTPNQGKIVSNAVGTQVRSPTDEMTEIDEFKFSLVCSLNAEKDELGEVLHYFPPERFENANGLPLNRYGHGPFCKFRIPTNINESGVYLITSDEELKYIGECQDLSQRYNAGYGNISPRNCFKGGQETNCRINNLVLKDSVEGSNVQLWFHPTDKYKAVESALRANHPTPWNRI